MFGFRSDGTSARAARISSWGCSSRIRGGVSQSGRYGWVLLTGLTYGFFFLSVGFFWSTNQLIWPLMLRVNGIIIILGDITIDVSQLLSPSTYSPHMINNDTPRSMKVTIKWKITWFKIFRKDWSKMYWYGYLDVYCCTYSMFIS